MDGSGVREVELLGRLQKLPASRALLIFNACHAGEISPGSLGDTAEVQATGQTVPDELAAALLGTGEGRVLVTACREMQKSYFGRHDPTTLFGAALIDGLQGRDMSPRRGYISIFELYDYLYHTVHAAARRRWGVEQEPELTVRKGVGVMAVALYRGWETTATLGDAERPADLQSLGQVREIDRPEAEQKLEQLLSGKINLAAGRDSRGNTVVGGDQYNVRHSPGTLIKPQGPVEVRNVNTGGGDFAEGDIKKGILGGNFYGPAIGNVEGNVTLGSGQAPAEVITLGQVQVELRQALNAAEARGDRDLARELLRIVEDIDSAMAAQQQGNDSQLQMKLNRARRDMQALAEQRSELRELSRRLTRAR